MKSICHFVSVLCNVYYTDGCVLFTAKITDSFQLIKEIFVSRTTQWLNDKPSTGIIINL